MISYFNKLQNKPNNYKHTVNDGKKFIEVIFRSNSNENNYKFEGKPIDKDGINDLICSIFCKKIEDGDNERYNNKYSID